MYGKTAAVGETSASNHGRAQSQEWRTHGPIEMIPLDGIVMSGSSSVDESSFTGDRLRKTDVGTNVWDSTMNLAGYLSVKTVALAEESTLARMAKPVEEGQSQRSSTEGFVKKFGKYYTPGYLSVKTVALAEESTLARMAKLVEEGQSQRSSTEGFVKKFAKYYTPVVLLEALAMTLASLIDHSLGFHKWVYKALVVLETACPCALVISTPVTTACIGSPLSYPQKDFNFLPSRG